MEQKQWNYQLGSYFYLKVFWITLRLQQQKNTTWDQLSHAEDYVVFPDNIGTYLSIDETALSQGELYTVITNKAAGGKKGCLVAIIKGTDSERVNDTDKKDPPGQSQGSERSNPGYGCQHGTNCN
ncbi:hypothetical protein BH23BAC1_BH23BAC1_40860 [soil metagenome]